MLGLRSALVEDLYRLGDWDEALARAAELAPLLEEARDVWDLVGLRSIQALLLTHRGEVREAKPFLAWLAETGRAKRDPASALTCSLSRHLRHTQTSGLGSSGARSASRMPGGSATRQVNLCGSSSYWKECALRLPRASRLPCSLGRDRTTVPSACTSRPASPLCSTRLRASCLGPASGFADAAARWHGFETPYEEAQAALGQGGCLAALGREARRRPCAEGRHISRDSARSPRRSRPRGFWTRQERNS